MDLSVHNPELNDFRITLFGPSFDGLAIMHEKLESISQDLTFQ